MMKKENVGFSGGVKAGGFGFRRIRLSHVPVSGTGSARLWDPHTASQLKGSQASREAQHGRFWAHLGLHHRPG